MKKNLIRIFGVVLVVILLGFGYQFWAQYQSAHLDTKQESSTQYAVLYIQTGQVSIKPQGKTEYAEIKGQEAEIATGAFIKTGSAGEAYLSFPDKSMVFISPNTELQANYTGVGIDIFQVLGITLHRVQSSLQGKTYNVETTNVNAAAKGTVFSFEVPKTGDASVYVIESNVEVSQFSLKNGSKYTLNTKNIQAGKVAMVVNIGDGVSTFGELDLPADYVEKQLINERLNKMTVLSSKK